MCLLISLRRPPATLRLSALSLLRALPPCSVRTPFTGASLRTFHPSATRGSGPDFSYHLTLAVGSRSFLTCFHFDPLLSFLNLIFSPLGSYCSFFLKASSSCFSLLLVASPAGIFHGDDFFIRSPNFLFPSVSTSSCACVGVSYAGDLFPRILSYALSFATVFGAFSTLEIQRFLRFPRSADVFGAFRIPFFGAGAGVFLEGNAVFFGGDAFPPSLRASASSAFAHLPAGPSA